MYQIIGGDRKQYGPISADQIRQWMAEGRINAQTLVRSEGETVFREISTMPEFAASLPRMTAMGAVPPTPIAMHPAQGVGANKFALWALFTGIFSILPCCWGLLGIVSIILGIVGLVQIKQTAPPQAGYGFAVAGIVLGAVSLVLVIIMVIVMISFPQLFPNLPHNFPQ